MSVIGTSSGGEGEVAATEVTVTQPSIQPTSELIQSQTDSRPTEALPSIQTDPDPTASNSEFKSDSSMRPSKINIFADDDDPDQPLLPGRDANVSEGREQRVVVLEERKLTTTNTQSMMHLLKGNIGTGILAMPVAVQYAGLWVGTVGIAVIGCIAVHCMHLLVQSSHRLCERYGRSKLDYSEVVEEAVFGFYQRQNIAKIARFTVDVFLCITQFGFCIVYILFIAENIKQEIFVPGRKLSPFTEYFSGVDLNIRIYQTIVTAFLIPFCWVKSLKYLAPFSMVANIITVLGLVIILQYCMRDLPPYFAYPAFAGIDTLPLFFGIVIYAFEGISLVLPIENKMQTPKDFSGLNGVLNTGMVIVSVLYVAVGFYGFMRFGQIHLEGSITLNMPKDHWLYMSVKLLFAAAIFISYGVQFYVPAIILIPFIEKKLGPLDAVAKNCLIRTAFVIGTCIISIIVPHLDLMISLIGALASSALALIFPPILDTLVLWPDSLGRGKWKLIKNIAIALFGFVGFILGTVTSLMKIVEAFNHPDT